MRYLAGTMSLLAWSLSASCVSEDLPPIHLQIEYQLRCHPDHGCSGAPDEPPHALNGIDGHDGLELDCQLGDEIPNLSFTAATEEYSLSVNPHGLDDTDKRCVVRVVEANNTLEKQCRIKEGGKAKCNDDDQGADLPCQVAIERDGDSVKGTLCCRNIPLEGKNPSEGDLSLLGRNTFQEPASFEIEHCR